MSIERHIEILQQSLEYLKLKGRGHEFKADRFRELIGFLKELKDRRELEALYRSMTEKKGGK